MYKRILLAYDGSASGQQALLDCHEIAQWSHAELTLIAVIPFALTAFGAEGGVYDQRQEEAEKLKYQTVLDNGIRQLADAG